MTKITSLCLSMVVMFSCSKHLSTDRRHEEIKNLALNHLRVCMTQQDFEKIDQEKILITYEPATFIRIGLKAKDIYHEFILLKHGNNNAIEGGKLISISFTENETMTGTFSRINLESRETEHYTITHGYLQPPPWTPDTARPYTNRIVEENDIFPKLTTKLYYYEGPSIRAVDYIALEHAWNRLEPPTNGSSSYYQINQPSTTNPYGGGTSTASTAPPPVILVDVERGYQRPEADMNKIISCFYNVPDQGATCSMELLADVPVDSDPRALFNWLDNTTGHCFIKLSKSAGEKTFTHYIGFNPQSSLKSMSTTAPIPGKLVNDIKHEYNASIKMGITPSQLDQVLSSLQQKANAKIKYDIDDYNCTNLAVELFNIPRRSKPFNPILQRIPGSMNTRGSLTPQSVYLELQRMMKSDPAERPNITIRTGKTFASGASPLCN